MSPSRASNISFVAGVLLIVGGEFQCIEALAAIVRDEYLVVTPNYIYTFDLTAWGWIHLLIGLALVAIGICLLLGQGWAQVAGIVVAAISALINFTWLPYSPFWAILVIAVDLLIIWALASARAQPRLPTHPSGRVPQRSANSSPPPHRPVACCPETSLTGGRVWFSPALTAEGTGSGTCHLAISGPVTTLSLTCHIGLPWCAGHWTDD